MKTYLPKETEVTKSWCVVDASNQVLGRLASQVAKILTGKTKPIFSKQVDTGNFVVVINANKVKLTGKKLTDKMYHHYSGYQSGLKTIAAKDLLRKNSPKMIEIAVRGMLPKNHQGRSMLTKLKVYSGSEHPHASQKPVEYPLS